MVVSEEHGTASLGLHWRRMRQRSMGSKPRAGGQRSASRTQRFTAGDITSSINGTACSLSPGHTIFIIFFKFVKGTENKFNKIPNTNREPREVCTGFWWGSLRDRGHWGDPDVDGRIILRCTCRKWERIVGTRTTRILYRTMRTVAHNNGINQWYVWALVEQHLKLHSNLAKSQ